MPEETCTNLSKVLEILEDKAFDTTIIRKQEYDIIQNVLDSGQTLDVATIERILTICVQELDNGKNYSSNILKIISSILKKVENGEISPLPQFTSLALSILNTIRTAGLLKKLGLLQAMCFETLLLFPDETLITVFTNHSADVVEVLNIYCSRGSQESRLLTCDLLIKLLKILPPETKTTFLKENLSIWFGKFIPALITFEINGVHNLKPFEALEALTEALQAVNYAGDIHWSNLLEAMHNPKKYPSVMLTLLDNGHPYWHRLWIVFIKLLKDQITSNVTQGTAINSLLPVVEKAFKMDLPNRCRAFQCWDALIDNFKMETSEVYVAKRLKLLVIPLLSNNAKVEEVIVVKFKTWWHLIVQFEYRLDKYIDAILISFLNFCFGKNVVSTKPVFVPGLISNNTKKLCVEAFLEIAGHLACEGCDNVRRIPKLSRKLMATNTLVCYWNNFSYYLQKTIIIAADDSVGVMMEQVQCLWKSFVLTLGELPDNNVRKDIFNELLLTLEKLTQDSYATSDNIDKNKLGEIILHLILSLFSEKNSKLESLLKTANDEGPVFKILTIILGPISNRLYNSNDPHECVTKLKHVTNFMIGNATSCFSHIVDWLLRNMSPNDNTLVLWTALTESIYENSAADEVLNFEGVLLWPLQNMKKFTDVKFAASAWYSLYSLANKKIKNSGKDNVLDLLKTMEITDANKSFLLHVSLVILKDKLFNLTVNDCMNEIEIIKTVMDKVEDYKEFAKEFPVLVDNFRLLTNKIVKTTNNTIIHHAITITMKTLKLIALSFKQHSSNTNNLSSFIKDIHNGIDEVYTNKADLNLKQKIIKELLEYLSVSTNEYPLRHNIIFMLNTYLVDIREKQSSFYSEIKKDFDYFVSNSKNQSRTPKPSINQDKEKTNFTTPVTNVITRKAKKRQASIVDTVVENGEEYVVVKSNWKFNPRKLTENQKEKLQRKREDIPALYQDLSQSQDEYKLTPWKTDSQDTSTTNSSKSNSKTTEEASLILKNIPCTEVVPKILENIFAENIDNKKADTIKDKPLEDNSNKIKQITPKNMKSPRIALKDRVFKNVRVLIEKSQIQKDVKTMSESLQIDNIPKTPVSEAISAPTLTNSAPPKITADRPSRIKRTPRKYDDSEIFALKKRRNSVNQNASQSEYDQISDTSSVEINSLKETIQESEKLLRDDNNLSVHANKQSGVTKYTTDSNIESSMNIQQSQELTPEDRNGTKPSDKSAILCENNEIKCSTVEKCPVLTEDLPTVLTPVVVKSSSEDLVNEKRSESNIIISDKLTETPKCVKKKDGQVNSVKIGTGKKSRIEKELSIDMVEGHPFLKAQPEKRLTRKQLNDTANSTRRKSLTEKLNRMDQKNVTKLDKKAKEKDKQKIELIAPIVREAQEGKSSDSLEDLPCSEDIIESSQDSTVTTISVKSVKPVLKKVSVVIESIGLKNKDEKCPLSTQNLIESSEIENTSLSTSNQESKDDIEFPRNKTAMDDQKDEDLTENMDTEPIDLNKINSIVSPDSKAIDVHKDQDSTENMDTEPFNHDNVIVVDSQNMTDPPEDKDLTENMDTQPNDDTNIADIVVINDYEERPITLDSDSSFVGPETQELAEADTEPINSDNFNDHEASTVPIEKKDEYKVTNNNVEKTAVDSAVMDNNDEVVNKNQDDDAITEVIDISGDNEEDNGASSPFKDEAQRKKDFLDNTFEISPIKTLSPARDKQSPSPETSSDFVVIKLSSPVHSNGEPFEKCDSPEIFTEDKVSPDKRDLSPPREAISVVNNTSPSSSLSLKKNRTQVRSGGRAAQMLGLCVPKGIQTQTIMNSERSDVEEPKRCSTSNTPARKPLRIVYSITDNTENSDENEESEKFLKFQRSLPTADCSPSGPILKRKLAEITDEATISPASKRKRVSFHDPPVSTTVSVQKYIEPGVIRSPQNSAAKRQERQMRFQPNMKSAKKLDVSCNKLDTVLTKAVESFSDVQNVCLDDTQVISLDETPVVEVVKTSDLNDTDPICPELINCEDPIDVIATELSSPAMKTVFLKELGSNIVTVGDLAKLTELEVNRLCIKAPKVKITRKVLTDYAIKRCATPVEEIEVETVVENIKIDVEVQTNIVELRHTDIQTDSAEFKLAETQTDNVKLAHCYVQTKQSASDSTTDVIKTCLAERPDFIEKLCENLEDTSIQQFADKRLSFSDLSSCLIKKVTSDNAHTILNQVLDNTGTDRLSFLQKYLYDNMEQKDLTLLCIRLLHTIHDKPV